MSIELFSKTGKMALGSRLRLLAAKVTEDAGKLYELYGVDLAPKWFPVFFVLSEDGKKTITEIANQIGHSQPSVSKIIREMTAAGLVAENKKTTDKRQNLVALTRKGIALTEKIREQYIDVGNAIEALTHEATHNLWEALAEWEFLLDQQSLYKRVQEQRKKRERKAIRIVDYQDKYHRAFQQLNEEWIATWFELEEADRIALEQPKKYILNKGGYIFIALQNDKPVGTCALLKMNDPDYDFELAKMAVSPAVQGKGIGYLLAQAAIDKAIALGASRLFLESNTILKPAISLYQKLGFKKTTGHTSPYKRSNIQMELDLANEGRNTGKRK